MRPPHPDCRRAVLCRRPPLATAPSVPPSRATDRLTLDNYLDLETVSDPQLSPDGRQIIYTRGWIDKLNDRRESALWIMNADGSATAS
jgi:hypothetical protein